MGLFIDLLTKVQDDEKQKEQEYEDLSNETKRQVREIYIKNDLDYDDSGSELDKVSEEIDEEE